MTEDRVIGIIFLIFFIVVLFLIIRDILYSKVEEISENIKYLKKINEDFKFKDFHQKERIVFHRTYSYKQYNKTTSSDVIRFHIENNVEHLRDDIEIAIHNKKLYNNYLNLYESINLNTDSELIKKKIKSEKIFKKMEMKLFKDYKIKNIYDITLKLTVNYTSPGGRNRYNKSVLIKFEHLYNFYVDWKNCNKYTINAKYERSIMTDSMRYDVLKRDNFRCRICGATASEGAKLHVDHIIPVSKGGKTRMDNLQTLCDRCNMGKSNKL